MAKASVMATYPYTLVDAFTDRPLSGNPAAVIEGCAGLDGRAMCALAAELRLESACVLGTAPWTLRFFAPASEIPLCGHATVATIASLDIRDGGRVETPAGSLYVWRDGVRVGFRLPGLPAATPLGEAEAAGLASRAGLGEARLPGSVVWRLQTPAPMLAVRLRGAAAVDALRPQSAVVAAAIASAGCIALVVFAPDGPGRLCQRVFAPALGLEEDYATGSASAALCLALGAGRLQIRQRDGGGRPSRLEVEAVEGDGVWVRGAAVVVGRGRLELPAGWDRTEQRGAG